MITLETTIGIIFLSMFTLSGIYVVANFMNRLFNMSQPLPNEDPLPARTVILVQGEPAINITPFTIEIVPYRNNTNIPISVDPSYIQPINPNEIGEKEFHPSTYAIML
jgi:hypothetical protein